MANTYIHLFYSGISEQELQIPQQTLISVIRYEDLLSYWRKNVQPMCSILKRLDWKVCAIINMDTTVIYGFGTILLSFWSTGS